MRIAEAMTQDFAFVGPNEDVRQVARLMAEMDVGALPVGDAGTMIGLVTDHDIVRRCVAAGLDLDRATVRDVMSPVGATCHPDETVEAVAARSGGRGAMRRIPVVDDQEQVVGMISLSQIEVVTRER